MSLCFVIMPFGGYFDDYYQNVIKTAIARAGLDPVRADEIYSTGSILDDIYRKIIDAHVCLADVTGRNPNVSYELGMAHALNKPVVIVTQDIRDVPFDYRHLRIISYDPRKIGWQASFGESIAQTVREVLRDPARNLALKPAATSFDKLRQHLVSIFYDVECLIEKTDEMTYQPNGDSAITTRWSVTAQSPVFHLCHNLVSEKPGRIEVRRAYDKLSGRDLDYVEIEHGEKHLSYMMLLKQFKRPGQSFVVETEVFAEYYLFGLESGGEVTMSHQAAQRSNIKYSKKIERYLFPKTDAFRNVKATYLSHPRSEMVGQSVACRATGDAYVLELVYDAPAPYRQETGAVIRL